MGPSEDTLFQKHLAARPAPVTAFRQDFDMFQGQHGWQYVMIDDTGAAKFLTWTPADDGVRQEGSWACPDKSAAVVLGSQPW
ncbi:hypothetical protein WJX82_010488 [Trebouxia sp. C0006]